MSLPPRCKHVYERLAPATCVCTLCGEAPTIWFPHVTDKLDILYHADPHQKPYHTSTVPNLIMVGPRGTGKSVCMRMDAHMRAVVVPNYRYLVIRRTMKELDKSHLKFIDAEMKKFGGFFHHTKHEARYPNGSIGWYGFCDTEADVLNFLSAEYDMLVADEITTFFKELIIKMLSCVRVPEDSGRIGLFRGGTNKFGPGAGFVKQYFFDKNVTDDEDDEYAPEEWGVIEHKWGDNQHIDLKQYRKRLSGQQAHVKRAWIDNEWSLEGMYFEEFSPSRGGEPWHVIDTLPTVRVQGDELSILEAPFVRIYRTIDWGFYPDPAVCLWIAVLPNKRAIVFKERTWRRTVAADVARQIKVESAGMKIADSYTDPTMHINEGAGFTIAETFEQHGVPVTPATNKRDLYGYSVHNWLNTELTLARGDGSTVQVPQLQILSPQGRLGCPNLIRTFPLQVVDEHDPNKLGDGEDHYVIALAYFCMADAPAHVQAVTTSQIKPWMRPKWARRADALGMIHG